VYGSDCESLMKRMPDFKQNYCCPKCHGRSAAVSKTQLPRGHIPELLGLRGKYLLLTCGLCGYTEIYDQAIYARSMELEKDSGEVSQEA
jgi:predicted nucleic-acid-binding Zn-ribbon protein